MRERRPGTREPGETDAFTLLAPERAEPLEPDALTLLAPEREGPPGPGAAAGASGAQASAAGREGSGEVPDDDVDPALLYGRLREAPRGERGALLEAWRTSLRAVPTGPAARERRARLLRDALESGELGSQRDSGNLSERACAVEGLLALGYPHALEVHPDDLEHLRALQRLGSESIRGLLGFLTLSLAGLSLALVDRSGGTWPASPGLVAAAAAILMPLPAGAWLIWKRLAISRRREAADADGTIRNVRGVD